MKFYIECRNLFNKSNLAITNESMEEIATVQFKPKDTKFQLVVEELSTKQKVFIKGYPLKTKGRYQIFNAKKERTGKVDVGVKIIHSIIELDKYYFVKSAFWKIKYIVFDNRTVFSTLNLVRINGKRHYEIEMKEQDIVMITSLFLLARAVRLKSIIN